MRRTVIVLIVTSVLLWGSAALGRRSPTTRLDGDPDEYQAKAVHNETECLPWDVCRSGKSGTGRLAPQAGMSADEVFILKVLVPGTVMPGQSQAVMIWLRLSESLRPNGRGRLPWEVRIPGEKSRCSGEGR
jgi:hypothetical protein